LILITAYLHTNGDNNLPNTVCAGGICSKPFAVPELLTTKKKHTSPRSRPLQLTQGALRTGPREQAYTQVFRQFFKLLKPYLK